jgi:hypothetical protein
MKTTEAEIPIAELMALPFLRTREVQRIFPFLYRQNLDNYSKRGILKKYKIGGMTVFKQSEILKAIEDGAK